MSTHSIPVVVEHVIRCGDACSCQLHKHCNAWSQSCKPSNHYAVSCVNVCMQTWQSIQSTFSSVGPIAAVQQESLTAHTCVVHTSVFRSQEASERATRTCFMSNTNTTASLHAGIDSRSAHCRSQLSEAEQQSSVLQEQQEGAEELVRALRHELHSLRQDTNSVAANARQTISEKEALQVWRVISIGAIIGAVSLKQRQCQCFDWQ